MNDATQRRGPLWWVLVRHEWRLTMRDLGGQSKRFQAGKVRKPVGRKRRIAGYVVVAVLLHGAGALSLVLPRTWTDNQATRIAAIAVLAFLFTLMLSSAMSRVVSAFHERRDLDLLLGAPIPPMLILMIRALTIVVAVSALFALFVFPLADVGVATGHWWMARFYPLVPLMALTATAVALGLTGAFVRLVGVRRARVGLQVFSALIGASFYLVSQARQFLPARVATAAMDWMRDATRDGDAAWPVVAAARLAGGDWLAWAVFVLGAFGLFAASLWSARKRFVEVAQQPEADAVVVAPVRGKVERRTRTGFARSTFTTLLVKEWRLIVRSPQLISQILLQMLYLMPLMFVAFGHQGARMAWGPAAFAAGVVGIAGTLTASLAWLTVSAEDAPDLMAGSPKSPALILGTKLFAATGPTFVILLIVAVGTSQRSIGEAAIVLILGTLACISAAILEAATPTPGKRSDFQRRQKGRGVSAILEGVQFLLWAAAAGTAASGLWIVAAALVVVACIVPGLRLPRALAQPR